MSTEQFMAAFNQRVPPSPAAALPVVTFPTRTTFHLNGDVVQVVHVENAHTDGDSIVHFTNANVIHTGDTYMKDVYPFIDVGSGGSISGFIASADAVLSRSDASTKIIPGHGDLANRADLQRFHDMLVDGARQDPGADRPRHDRGPSRRRRSRRRSSMPRGARDS